MNDGVRNPLKTRRHIWSRSFIDMENLDISKALHFLWLMKLFCFLFVVQYCIFIDLASTPVYIKLYSFFEPERTLCLSVKFLTLRFNTLVYICAFHLTFMPHYYCLSSSLKEIRFLVSYFRPITYVYNNLYETQCIR